jgi:hypothetical protein
MFTFPSRDSPDARPERSRQAYPALRLSFLLSSNRYRSVRYRTQNSLLVSEAPRLYASLVSISGSAASFTGKAFPQRIPMPRKVAIKALETRTQDYPATLSKRDREDLAAQAKLNSLKKPKQRNSSAKRNVS